MMKKTGCIKSRWTVPLKAKKVPLLVNIDSILDSNYFCCPRRCAYTILEVFTIFLSTVLHGNFYRFYGFCHENKVWYWVLFVIPPLPVRIETATLASYPSASKDLVLVLIGSGISPLQHHALSGYRLSIHHVQHNCTMYMA